MELADLVKTQPRTRKARDFLIPRAKPAKRAAKHAQRGAKRAKHAKHAKHAAWRLRLQNKKDEENHYILTLIKPGQHVFTLDDPTHNTPFRTTNMLLAHGAQVTALSCDPNIMQHEPHPKLTLVHDYTTNFLENPTGKKPHLVWLDYCASVRRSAIDWVKDLKLALRWMHRDGVVMLTFSKRGVANYMGFAVQQIHAVGAYLLDVHEYQGETNASMCVFSLAKRYRKIMTLSQYTTPQPHQRVRVTDTTGTWEGTVCHAYTPKEFLVRHRQKEFTVMEHEITHVMD
jgi:hypothetical protein